MQVPLSACLQALPSRFISAESSLEIIHHAIYMQSRMGNAVCEEVADWVNDWVCAYVGGLITILQCNEETGWSSESLLFPDKSGLQTCS